jgi:hypothetical protein
VTRAESEANQQDDLIDRLASHDIRYLQGGGRQHISSAAPLAPLLTDLARATSSRLRSSLIALLLRHPGHAPAAEAAARDLAAEDSAGRLLLLSIVVAAALQNEWSFSLDLYLPSQVRLEADHLAAHFGLPPPRQDFGRPCLAAAAHLLRKDCLFPVNYEADWENAARRLLSQLAQEAHARGA